jgi:predicted dehydrogenase
LGERLNLAIIGCGLMGSRRAKYLGSHHLKVVVDVDIERARSVAADSKNETIVSTDWRDAVANPSVQAIILATTPDVMPAIILQTLSQGKHVLVDKPAARSAVELEPVVKAVRQSTCQVRVGFNHRYHPALQKARQLVTAGAVGELMYIRARYGHGGRLGYEQEWRAQPDVSGGGELIDQGTHLIDLSRWFLGDFNDVVGHSGTYFWDMPVDDNAFLLLRTSQNQVAFLHASWSEWKNLFCFEIFGKTGKLQIDGLGGSYGVETLTFYKMRRELGPPDVEKWEFGGPDLSWQTEFDEFVSDIASGKSSGPTAEDAYAALKIAETVYAGNRTAAGVVE